MKVDMLMPQMGESIAEATISKWRKLPGDGVKKDEIILEISTDKVDSEIPAPASGTLAEVLYKEGDVVPVKTKIAVIETAGGQSVVIEQPATKAPTEQTNGAKVMERARPAATVVEHVQSVSTSERFYSPLVKSLAAKHGVSLSELDTLEGSGQGGRLTKQDFYDYLEARGSKPAAVGRAVQVEAKASIPAAEAPTPALNKPTIDIPSLDWRNDGSKVVPMDNMRRAIAEHMLRSKHTSPHVYSVQEVDVSRIARWREKVKREFQEKEGFNLSFTPFFLEAAVKGLLKFPYINSSVDGNTVILKRNINLGCAVALGNTGLIVPVIKRAEERNMVGLARALNDLASRARDKKLLPDEVMGGTFTVTNPGVFGTLIGTPIINQPQVAILCLGKIEKRPVVVDDMIAIRERCYLTLSYDHRIVDGGLAGQYLAFICEHLENWDLNRPLY